MKQEQINKLTLHTNVYHPFYGKGELKYISTNKLNVDFDKGVCLEFSTSGTIGGTKFIEELYLKPVKIIEI